MSYVLQGELDLPEPTQLNEEDKMMAEMRDKFGTPYEGMPGDDSVETETRNIKYLVVAVASVAIAIFVVFSI